MKGILRTHRQLEALEDRCILSGDALVAVVDGELQITGDADDNQIAISAAFDGATRSEDSFVVTGLNGTTINGSGDAGGGDASGTFSAVSKISVNLQDGNDTVQLTDAVVQGKVAVSTGAGDDQIYLGQFSGQATADAGGSVIGSSVGGIGDSANLIVSIPTLSVAAGPLTVHGQLTISAGDGDDLVAFSHAGIAGHAKVDTGAGDDQVTIDGDGEVASTASLNAGLNARLLDGLLDLNTDLGLNARGRLYFNLGDGADSFIASDLKARGSVTVNDPQTDTHVELDNVDAGHHGLRFTNNVNVGLGLGGHNGNSGSDAGGTDNGDDSGSRRLLQRAGNLVDRVFEQLGDHGQDAGTDLLGGLFQGRNLLRS